MKKIIALLAVIGLSFTALADGKTVWEKNCQKCHGADGKGQTVMGKKMGAKDYSDSKVQGALTDAAAVKATKEGFKVADKVVMKPSENLIDDDIKAVVAYLRSLKK